MNSSTPNYRLVRTLIFFKLPRLRTPKLLPQFLHNPSKPQTWVLSPYTSTIAFDIDLVRAQSGLSIPRFSLPRRGLYLYQFAFTSPTAMFRRINGFGVSLVLQTAESGGACPDVLVRDGVCVLGCDDYIAVAEEVGSLRGPGEGVSKSDLNNLTWSNENWS